jgi:hypothetical protein
VSQKNKQSKKNDQLLEKTAKTIMNPPISQNMTLAQPHTHTPQHHTIQSTILKKMPHCGKDKICFNVKHALNYYPMGSLNTETTTDQNHCAAVVCASSTTAHVSAQLMC